MGLVGCTFLPTADYSREDVLKTGRTNNAAIVAITAQDAQILAAEWRNRLESAANNRRDQDFAAQEVLYYGTLLFAGAQSAIASKGVAAIPKDLLHARNVGGALAIGSSLFSQHYKVSEQRPIFEKAAARMRCVTDAMADIRPEFREDWTQDEFDRLRDTDNKLIAPLYYSFPQAVVEFIERRSLIDLRAALSAVTLGMPSKDEMAKTFQDWKDQKDKANNSAVSTANSQLMAAPSSQQRTSMRTFLVADRVSAFDGKTDSQIVEEKRRFVAALLSFSANLTTCHTTFPQ